MYTVQLNCLANAASLPDDEFRIFQEPLSIPLPVTLSQAQAVLEKFAGTVLNGETGWIIYYRKHAMAEFIWR